MPHFSLWWFLCRHFSSPAALDHFTSSLDAFPSPDNTCAHCGKYDQWVSHGCVYKDSPTDAAQVVGKRIICSNRYGRTGCGRTRQLYLADVIPNRQYRLAVLIAFIERLLGGALVEQAYLDAIGCATKEPRQAWRWLKDLFKQLPQWRTLIAKPVECFVPPQRSRCLKRLLPTLERLFNGAIEANTGAFQWQHQRAFF